MATVHVNGVDLYYERAGQGDALVLTHGAWSDGRTWQALVERLAGRFEVVTWDRRGHSRSQDGDGPGSWRQDAGDLAGLIEHLGDGPVHLAGSSAGGSVTLNLVALRPDLVRSAVVHEPVPLSLLDTVDDPHLAQLLEEFRQESARVVDLINRGDHRRAAHHFIDNVAVGPGAWDSFPKEFREILVHNASTVVDELRDALEPESLDIELLEDSKASILITKGTESPQLEMAGAEELARRLPAAHLATLEGAGHVPYRTHTDEYAAMITEFIETGEASPLAGKLGQPLSQ